MPDLILQTLCVGALVYVVWILARAIISHVTMCQKLRKVPHRPTHFLYGNSREVRNSDEYFDIVSSLVEHEGARMYSIWFGQIPIVGVTHPNTLKQLIRQESAKARGLADGYRMIEPWLGEGLLLSDGAKWYRSRRLLTPAFHFDILRGYVPVMNSCSSILNDKLWKAGKGGSSVDVFPLVSQTTLETMLKCSLSFTGNMDDEKESAYLEGVKTFSDILWKRLVTVLLMNDFMFYRTKYGKESASLCKMFHDFTGEIIKNRRTQLAENPDLSTHKRRMDFLDILLTARDENGQGLSDQDVQAEVDTFTFEGHDTTASAVSWTIYALAKYPDLQEKVFKEMDNLLGSDDEISMNHLSQIPFTTQFIKEVLRFFSPVPLIARKHSKPITIDGIEIPVGPRIDINIVAIHHNKEVWPDHMEFRPDRFSAENRDETELYGFVPFSAGSRNCIGQIFAMNEIKIIIGRLVKRFRIKLDTSIETKPEYNIVTKATNGINIFLEERKIC